mgnify:CR=1 FL=1
MNLANLPSRVQLIDVGPRDGLQNEKQPVPAEVKIGLVHRLQAAGLTEIEVTSFVSPKWVPQMADNAVVMAGIERQSGVRYSVLTPNMVGYQAAVASKPDEIVVFGAASQAFSQKNINCSIEESMERFAPVVQAALAAGIAVRGAMSCTVGCPYEGEVSPASVAHLAGLMKQIGVQRVDVADTIGTGTPLKVQKAIGAALQHFDIDHICGHFHDTYGRACGTFSRRWRVWAVALMPRAPRATWPPKTWSTCCTAWALRRALIWTNWWMQARSSATFWAANPTRTWPRPC